MNSSEPWCWTWGWRRRSGYLKLKNDSLLFFLHVSIPVSYLFSARGPSHPLGPAGMVAILWTPSFLELRRNTLHLTLGCQLRAVVCSQTLTTSWIRQAVSLQCRRWGSLPTPSPPLEGDSRQRGLGSLPELSCSEVVHQKDSQIRGQKIVLVLS